MAKPERGRVRRGRDDPGAPNGKLSSRPSGFVTQAPPRGRGADGRGHRPGGSRSSSTGASTATKPGAPGGRGRPRGRCIDAFGNSIHVSQTSACKAPAFFAAAETRRSPGEDDEVRRLAPAATVRHFCWRDEQESFHALSLIEPGPEGGQTSSRSTWMTPVRADRDRTSAATRNTRGRGATRIGTAATTPCSATSSTPPSAGTPFTAGGHAPGPNGTGKARKRSVRSGRRGSSKKVTRGCCGQRPDNNGWAGQSALGERPMPSRMMTTRAAARANTKQGPERGRTYCQKHMVNLSAGQAAGLDSAKEVGFASPVPATGNKTLARSLAPRLSGLVRQPKLRETSGLKNPVTVTHRRQRRPTAALFNAAQQKATLPAGDPRMATGGGRASGGGSTRRSPSAQGATQKRGAGM